MLSPQRYELNSLEQYTCDSMPFARASGILLHPTSLPDQFGIGSLGAEARKFIDFLAETGQQLWQILPLGPTGHGNSPYMSYSSMAGNPLLISLPLLQERGVLSQQDLVERPHFSEDRVDYEAVLKFKIPLLEKAAANFKQQADPEQLQLFQDFCKQRSFWLDDYALFMALKQAHDGAGWHQWDADIALRKPEAVSKWQKQLSHEIFCHQYLQFEFFQQWSALRTYANEQGVQIIGDMPIYVAHDSADVWGSPDIFCIDPETLEPSLMAGVPPDYFSATGQLWGNPIYNWEALERQDFQWWIQRFQALLEYVDLIRIDHFRGFQAYWAVAHGETTAINGEWVEAPGEVFFTRFQEKLGTSLPILAEDLGVITPEVEALRDQFGFPGMKILHFAFGSDHHNPYLPFNCHENCMIYTGTHDNNTTIGWFEEIQDYERDRFLTYVGGASQDGIQWDLIRLALSSRANQAIMPMQDILGLGAAYRMNTPGTAEGNWEWRYQPAMMKNELRDRLKTLTHLCGRAPAAKPNYD